MRWLSLLAPSLELDPIRWGVQLFSEHFAETRSQTAVAISTVLMAAACFPEEQAKVQAEIDAVIGRHRGSLYLVAVVLT